jgi:hypothetical protein
MLLTKSHNNGMPIPSKLKIVKCLVNKIIKASVHVLDRVRPKQIGEVQPPFLITPPALDIRRSTAASPSSGYGSCICICSLGCFTLVLYLLSLAHLACIRIAYSTHIPKQICLLGQRFRCWKRTNHRFADKSRKQKEASSQAFLAAKNPGNENVDEY